MENPVKKVYRVIVPDPEELWGRGNADMRKIEIDNERYEDVPFFDVEISDVEPAKDGYIIDHRGKNVGDFRSFSIKTSDGIDRTARIYIPDDAHLRSADVMIHADTAWTTTITGHNDYMASTFVSKTGLPMMIVGAEHGTNERPYPQELLRLPRTIKQSTAISLAKSAQSSQLITEYLRDEFSLPHHLIKTGESRGAMLAAGHFPYAEKYGNEIVYSDITAPCLPQKLLSERADWLRLARWPASELLGTVALGLELTKQKALKRQMGTVALNPNFLASNIVGVGPALFSGESGRFAAWKPREAAMYISTFKNDTVSRPDVWRELYDGHSNVYIREHKSGTHMTLARDEVIASKATRMNAVVDMLEEKNYNLQAVTRDEWLQIYHMGIRESTLFADVA